MQFIKAADKPYLPANHEDKNNPGVFRKILLTKDELLKGRVQMVNYAHLPVGKHFRAHYHEDMEEVFILTSGKAQMIVDGETVTMTPGDTVVVLPRGIHMMKNNGDSDVYYVVLGITTEQNGKTVVVETSD